MNNMLVTLDFDGAVSPIDNERDFTAEGNFEGYSFAGFDVFIRDEVLSFLHILHDLQNKSDGTLQVLWASTWEELTEDFWKDSEGAVPHFGYLNVKGSKADAILREMKLADAKMLISFEDSEDVNSELRQKLDLTKDSFDHVMVQPEKSEGITDSQISAVLAKVTLFLKMSGKI